MTKCNCYSSGTKIYELSHKQCKPSAIEMLCNVWMAKIDRQVPGIVEAVLGTEQPCNNPYIVVHINLVVPFLMQTLLPTLKSFSGHFFDMLPISCVDMLPVNQVHLHQSSAVVTKYCPLPIAPLRRIYTCMWMRDQRPLKRHLCFPLSEDSSVLTFIVWNGIHHSPGQYNIRSLFSLL